MMFIVEMEETPPKEVLGGSTSGQQSQDGPSATDLPWQLARAPGGTQISGLGSSLELRSGPRWPEPPVGPNEAGSLSSLPALPPSGPENRHCPLTGECTNVKETFSH